MEPSDKDEETRCKGIAEQCWLGPICLLFWVIAIMGFIHGCARGAECKLAWDHPPYHERVTHWEIFRGIERLATVHEPCATLDLPTDRRSTLTVAAVNAAGHSSPVNITVVPFVPQTSVNLANWNSSLQKTIFVEASPRMFARFSFPRQ
ncbi:MAG: hypothetical protein ACK528_13495 [Alphaproteobacteria bacterium]